MSIAATPLFCSNASTNINKEIEMNQIIHRFRARAVAQTLAATTFCEGCSGVCTSDCRRVALQERRQETAQRTALFRV